MSLAAEFLDDFDNLTVGGDDIKSDLEIGVSDVEGFIAQSQKKGAQLCHEGYYYRVQSESKGVIKWRCIKTGKNKPNCTAKCKSSTKEIGAKCVVEIVDGKHNHDFDDKNKLIKMEQRRCLKENAINGAKKPRTIIHNLYQNLDEKQVLEAPSYQADYMALWRERKKYQPEYPPSPNNLNEVVFPDWLLKTVKRQWIDGEFVEVEGEDFLIYASPIEEIEVENSESLAKKNLNDSNLKRFFMFGTEKSLKLVENSHIYCDGTFDIAPLLFQQVYTIHTIVGDKCVPVLCAFLPQKTKTIYTKMLEIVKSKINIPPLSITSDFESAFINAAKKVFPDSEISLCFFHFKQSLFRKIQNLGLVSDYMNDNKIKLALKIPQAIAFLPTDQVWQTFHDLKENYALEKEKVKAFYDYIEEHYVGKIELLSTGRRYKKITKKQLIPKLFSIEDWNINSRILSDLPRTNNYSEAWNGSFSVN